MTLMKKLRREKRQRKKNSKQATGDVQNGLVQTISRLVQKFEPASKKVFAFRTLGRKRFVYYTSWDVATCCPVLTICPTCLLVLRFFNKTALIRSASGVRSPRSSRQIQVRRLRTLPHQAKSEVTCEGSVELSAPSSLADRSSVELQFR